MSKTPEMPICEKHGDIFDLPKKCVLSQFFEGIILKCFVFIEILFLLLKGYWYSPMVLLATTQLCHYRAKGEIQNT